jgi:hypothetical protein
MWPNAYTPLFSNTGAGGIEEIAPTVIAATTAASPATLLPGNPLGDPANCDICIENTTNGWAFCNFGDVNVPAATLSNGIGVPPGGFRIIRVAPTAAYVSVILNTAATAGPVRFQRGAGIT